MSASRVDEPGGKQCPACSADSAEPVLSGPDGRCPSCGRWLVGSADHVETDLGQLAGVSDRGLRHHRNEDAFALAVVDTGGVPVPVAVVSDGVSSAPYPDQASFTAAQTAITLLAEGIETGQDPAEVSRTAVRAAGRALTGLAGATGSPAATYVSAIASRDQITVCWLGDSRAYWLAADGTAEAGPDETTEIYALSRRVTQDDSLAEEIVTAGLATMEEAMASPQAHVITRWLGADLPDPQPHVEQFAPPGPGVLLVCSDGLWNYRPEAAELAAMAMPAALTRPLDAAAGLVKFAVECGGLDNITVVLIPFPPEPGQETAEQAE